MERLSEHPEAGASRRVARLALALLVASLGLGGSGTAHAARAPADGDGWLSAWSGLSFGDTIVLGNADATDAVTLNGGGEAPLFGIDAHYRTTRLDLGVILEGLGSGRFDGLELTHRIGSQFRVAANLRWRFVDEAWGALFVSLAPGMMIFGHSDALRGQVVQLTGGDVLGFEEADEFSLGFTLGLDFGGLVYLSERLALSFKLAILTNTTSIKARDQDVSYTAVRGTFTAGLEWRM
ncbi:MAG: hypothetical protein EP329_10620 [Deltaproteobacteria bacterium]|nr:MAG: hypothetical protein EP329_10620 [Deltaproteobacteria bacterium]